MEGPMLRGSLLAFVLVMACRGRDLPEDDSTADSPVVDSADSTDTDVENRPPSVTDVADALTIQDTASAPVAFTIDDPDDTLACATAVTLTSSDTAVVAAAGLSLVGARAATCALVATPIPGAHGATTITVRVADPHGASAQDTFTLTVDARPEVTAVDDQATTLGIPIAGVSFTLHDPDDELSCATAVTAASDDAAVVAPAGLAVTGADQACALSITPAGVGTAAVTLTVRDPHGAEASTTFDVVVNGPPQLSAVADQRTNQDEAVGPVSFTVQDADDALTCGHVRAVSSAPGVVANAGVAIAGTAQDCALTVTPVPAAHGTTTVTLSVDDGRGGTAATSFDVVVNGAPVLSPVADQTTLAGTPVTVPFTVSDPEGGADCDDVTVSVGIATAVVSGTGGSCTATLTPTTHGTATVTLTATDGEASTTRTFGLRVDARPTLSAIGAQRTHQDTTSGPIGFTVADADHPVTCAQVVASTSDPSVIAAAGLAVSGAGGSCTLRATPAPGAFGTATVTLSVTDPDGATASRSFTLTVNARPILGAVADQVAQQDTPAGPIAFTLSDPDDTLTCAAVSVTAAGTVVDSATAGPGSSGCAVTVVPRAGHSGTATVTLTATDDEGATATRSFTVRFNGRPTLTAPDDAVTEPGRTVGPLAFTIGDAEGVSCAQVSGATSDAGVVTRGGIVIDGAGTDCTVELLPRPGVTGVVSVTLTLTDDDGGQASASFSAVFDHPPTVTPTGDRSVRPDTDLGPIAFSVADADHPVTCDDVVVSSDAAVTATHDGGAGTACQITARANQAGTAVITYTVTDPLGRSASWSFQVFVEDRTLVLSEVVVTPTAAEFIEIHNVSDQPVDLSAYHLTDAGATYTNIVTGQDAGGGSDDDFHARFPAGATLDPGAYVTVALSGSDAFFATYGVLPDFELWEDGTQDAVPDLDEAFPGGIGGQGSLADAGEVVILYRWDGASDRVYDADYVLWGDRAAGVDKTGVSVDGPDDDDVPTPYAAEVAVGSQDVVYTGAHANGGGFSRIDLAEGAERADDGNGIGGSDETSEDLSATWSRFRARSPGAATPAADPGTPGNPGIDCRSLYAKGITTDGTYWLDPNGTGAFQATCLMSASGGGWTLLTSTWAAALTAGNHEYLYYRPSGARWYRSPVTNKVWTWASYQALAGTYAYGAGHTTSASLTCTTNEAGGWGVGCSSGGGNTAKVLTIYTSNPTAGTGTVCQDTPDWFQVGACASSIQMYERRAD